jgi:uroporphyrinogen-III synthase
MIYITRPSPEGDHLTELLNQANISAFHLPFFKISAGQGLNQIQQQLNQLMPSDIVIVVSPQVSHMISQYQPKLSFPNHLRYFAIGKKSAELFGQQNGIDVDYPDQEHSEGLLALLKQHALAKRSVLILCGNNGRQYLSEQLKLQHANVTLVECYFRQLITYPPTILANDINQQVILVTSVDHLLQLEAYCQNKHKCEAQLIVTSSRIFEEAKRLKWHKILQIVSANNQFLFKTIITLCHNAKNNYQNI